MSLEETILEYESKDKDELAEIATENFACLFKGCIDEGADMELAFNACMTLMASLITSDGLIMSEEIDLVKHITDNENASDDDVKEMIKKYSNFSRFDAVVNFVKSYPSLKEYAKKLCVAVSYIDNDLDIGEFETLVEAVD